MVCCVVGLGVVGVLGCRFPAADGMCWVGLGWVWVGWCWWVAGVVGVIGCLLVGLRCARLGWIKSGRGELGWWVAGVVGVIGCRRVGLGCIVLGWAGSGWVGLLGP